MVDEFILAQGKNAEKESQQWQLLLLEGASNSTRPAEQVESFKRQLTCSVSPTLSLLFMVFMFPGTGATTDVTDVRVGHSTCPTS